MQKILFALFIIATASISSAQIIDDIDEISLDELINIKASIASKTEKGTRESPGIVTVITKEEIKKMGARDLMDVLSLVPGFNFASDVQGIVGLGVRGNWANEGKYALMVDGQEMNEILYASTQLGNHYPVDQIKQIEIIRGPGSAIYGGTAELAVVHIITDKGSDINGSRAVVTYGQMREDYGRRNLSLQYGKKFKEWDISVAGFVGEGRRGDNSFTGYASNATPLPNYLSEAYNYSDKNVNNLNPAWLNIGANNGKWDFRVIYDNYHTTSRAQYGYSGLNDGLKNYFKSLNASVKYDFKINKSITITPTLSYRDQQPWQQTDTRTLGAFTPSIFDIQATRLKYSLNSNIQFSDSASLLFGIEVYRDEAKAKSWDDGSGQLNFAMTGRRDINFDSIAAYAQQSFNLFDFADVTLGGRWEELTAPTGRKVSNTVPRFAITKATSSWHLKGLASQAFRTPSIFNFDADFEGNGASYIKPEVTTTFEVEAGHTITKNSYLTLNLFAINIKDPIIYEVINNTDAYANYPKVQTQGAELEYKIKSSWGFANINYAFYQRGTNQVPTYSVNDSKELLAMPQHKATFLASYKAGLGNLSVNPSVIYLGKMHSYAYDSVNDAEVLIELPSVTLFNLYFTYPDLFVKGLELGFGVFNAFDEDQRFAQPYQGEMGHIPGASREYVARLSYSWMF